MSALHEEGRPGEGRPTRKLSGDSLRVPLLHPCGVCVDDGMPHFCGIKAPPELREQYASPQRIAKILRNAEWARIRAARRQANRTQVAA